MQFWCNNWLCDIICRNKSMFFKNMLFKFFLYVFILFICKQLCNDNFTIIAVKESLKKKEKQCSNNIVFLFFFYLFLYLILILIVVNVAHIHFWIDQYFFHSFDIRLLIGMITWPFSSKKNPRSVPRLQYFPYGAFNACCSIWVFWFASRQCWGWCVVFNEKTRSDTRCFSTPPTSQYCTRAYADRAFPRGNMILHTRHAPRFANGVKIAASRCTLSVSKRITLHATRINMIAARTVFATDEFAHWLNAFDQRKVTRAQRTLVSECLRRSETYIVALFAV